MRNKRDVPLFGGEPDKPPLKLTPFPGLIDGNHWRIKEGRWPVFIDRSDLEGEGGVMQIPLDDSDYGRKLRLHEQAHIADTPVDAEVEGVSPQSIEACEDGRIIERMNRHDPEWQRINLTTDVMPESIIKRHKEDFERLGRKLRGEEEPTSIKGTMPTPTIPLVQAARLLAMTRGYFEAQYFNDMARRSGMPWAQEKVDELHREYIGSKKDPTFEDTVAYATELERWFNEMEQAMLEANAELAEAELPHRMHEIPDQKEEKFEWGKMKIQEAPLTMKLRQDPSRKMRPVDMGAVPRYMHRLLSDQRVFGRRRKHVVYQGTLLIDHSGSMHLSTDEVDQILSIWPAVTIATYCGTGRGHGIMRIVARNGRRAEQSWLGRPAAGANEIDGPALDWLIKQKRPRIGVSDGHVSGAYENFHPWFGLDAAKKVTRGKIKRIDAVRDLLRD